MPEVVIIGGGLTGLAAAWELERLKIAYTLIELKSRLGGSIRSEEVNDFILDAGPLTYEKRGDWPFLSELGLEDEVAVVGQSNGAERVLFKHGTETLTRALAAKITNVVMPRMAVSSIGMVDAEYGVCLENGLLLTAHGLIVTAPARHAEHMLRSLQPEAAYRLLDYRYDSVARVLLGYRREDVPTLPQPFQDDYPVISVEAIEHPTRVPDGHMLVQASVRLGVVDEVPADLPLQLAAAMHWPLNPAVQRVVYWPDAFSLTRDLPGHDETMTAIEHLLPPCVALVGSDYRARTLDQQVEQGRAAARAVAERV